MDWTEFRAVEPESGWEDLLPLLDMVGDADVIGLGECAHGSHEVHLLKHRILELLAEELPISAVVLEANLADVMRVNVFVLEGRGDPEELVRRHLYWGVRTGEMVDLLRRLWDYNATGRGPVALAGCDMQRIDTATEIVGEHLRRAHPELAASVADRYEQVLEADRVRWLSGMGVQAWFPVEEARGRRIRILGFIRTEDVSGHACIWGWTGGAKGTLAHDALEGRRPRGTTEWRQYGLDLDVPEEALHVSFGCFLAGNGKAWFDGLKIEIDGKPWTDPERIDLDFRTDALHGFWVDPRNRATLDADVTRAGRRSLRIEPAEAAPECETSDVEAQMLAKQVVAELSGRLSGPGAARTLRCARAVVQALEIRTGGGDAVRARSMAKNVEWLLERRPGTKVVFWAHNEHIARGGGETGAFLARSLGERYVPVGLTLGEGTCLTRARRWREGLRTHRLATPPPESFEHRLLETRRPRLILDLRTAEATDPEWGWLSEKRPFRHVGASPLPHEFFEQRIRDDFDLLVWIEKTAAARPLPRMEE